MTVVVDSFTEARKHLKQLFDAAERGVPTSLRRDEDRVTVIDIRRFVALLQHSLAGRAEVVREAGGWSVFIPGLPVAADGATYDEAIDAMVDALREYAEDWEARLHTAPNHADNWALVQLIGLSDREGLRDWLVGAG